MRHKHSIGCYASNFRGPLAYTPCREDGLDRNLTNLKIVDFSHTCPGLTLICDKPCVCYDCKKASEMIQQELPFIGET